MGRASMAVAFVALFIAGAGSVEAARLITGKQIKNNSVTSADVRNGSLLRRDFRSGQLPRGPQGLPGASGRAGRDGFGQVVYESGTVGAPVEGTIHFTACPPGLVPVGGDAYAVRESDQTVVPEAEIADFFYDPPGPSLPVGWGAMTPPVVGQDLVVEAICANSSRTSISSASRSKVGPAKATKPLP